MLKRRHSWKSAGASSCGANGTIGHVSILCTNRGRAGLQAGVNARYKTGL
jgi:hypothetical protein